MIVSIRIIFECGRGDIAIPSSKGNNIAALKSAGSEVTLLSLVDSCADG
jgi:hypothetical protein